jgi:hypothetical protein
MPHVDHLLFAEALIFNILAAVIPNIAIESFPAALICLLQLLYQQGSSSRDIIIAGSQPKWESQSGVAAATSMCKVSR